MATSPESTAALKALYAGNALWHTSALVHFSFRSAFMMKKLALRKKSRDPATSSSPEGDAWHHDIMSYLGGMNSSLALLALFRVYALFKPDSRLPMRTVAGEASLDVIALSVLGLANFSQALCNFTISAQNDRWIMGKGLDRITVLDALFTVLDWTAAFVRLGAVA
ncbi:hypothetical protein LTR27_004802 [Elasticomyces elasticus]|nr:hypothetical protein LTR27_004802 [Elasticomyces elasticus]